MINIISDRRSKWRWWERWLRLPWQWTCSIERFRCYEYFTSSPPEKKKHSKYIFIWQFGYPLPVEHERNGSLNISRTAAVSASHIVLDVVAHKINFTFNVFLCIKHTESTKMNEPTNKPPTGRPRHTAMYIIRERNERRSDTQSSYTMPMMR